MGEIQPPRGGFIGSQREDVGVRGGFQKRQAAGHDEIGREKKAKLPRAAGRDEEQATYRIQREACEDSAFVGESPDEKRSRKRHDTIAPVKSRLHQRAFKMRQEQHIFERRDHGVRDVVGKAPKTEERCDKKERGDELTGEKGGRAHEKSLIKGVVVAGG